jgi:hypothetical protein
VLADAPLISQHLRKLSLDSVWLKDCFMDFSSCPVLEDLKMVSCSFGTKMSSKSLKWLSIRHCDFDWDTRGCISVPGLLSLEMADLDEGLCPSLESMPSLATAFIRIGTSCNDHNIMDDDDPSVILDGISDAANLELMAEAHEKVCLWLLLSYVIHSLLLVLLQYISITKYACIHSSSFLLCMCYGHLAFWNHHVSTRTPLIVCM